MLSSVLNSPHAIRTSIRVVEAFVRLREMIASNKDLAARVEKLETDHHEAVSVINAIVDEIRQMKAIPLHTKRKMGFDL